MWRGLVWIRPQLLWGPGGEVMAHEAARGIKWCTSRTGKEALMICSALYSTQRFLPSCLCTRRTVFHCPGRTADSCMQLRTRIGSLCSLLWHASAQWASRNMINSWIFPLANYILPYLIEQFPGLKSSVCLKTGCSIWPASLITWKGQTHKRCAGMQVTPAWDHSAGRIIHWAGDQRRPGIYFCLFH